MQYDSTLVLRKLPLGAFLNGNEPGRSRDPSRPACRYKELERGDLRAQSYREWISILTDKIGSAQRTNIFTKHSRFYRNMESRSSRLIRINNPITFGSLTRNFESIFITNRLGWFDHGSIELWTSILEYKIGRIKRVDSLEIWVDPWGSRGTLPLDWLSRNPVLSKKFVL